jgi:hypothetical protein
MILIVSGSRRLYTHEWLTIDRTLTALFKERGVTELYHGDAAGVDKYAARVGADAGLAVTPFPADWAWGKSAGMLRNAVMLRAAIAESARRQLPDPILVAFPRPDGKGTQGCMKEAQSLGLEVIVQGFSWL